MWWLAVECYDPLGIDSRMKTIKDNRITASSMKDDQHKPSFARLRGKNAWCSSRKDMSPYLQISLAEAYQISGIETQGSESDCMWVKLYEIHYTTNVTAGWKVHKVLNIFKKKARNLDITNKLSFKQAHKYSCKMIHRNTAMRRDTHTYRPTDRLTDWLTDSHRKRKSDRQTET